MCFSWDYSRNEKEKDDYINKCTTTTTTKAQQLRWDILRQLLIKTGNLLHSLTCHIAYSCGIPCAMTLTLVGCGGSDFQLLSYLKTRQNANKWKPACHLGPCFSQSAGNTFFIRLLFLFTKKCGAVCCIIIKTVRG